MKILRVPLLLLYCTVGLYYRTVRHVSCVSIVATAVPLLVFRPATPTQKSSTPVAPSTYYGRYLFSCRDVKFGILDWA